MVDTVKRRPYDNRARADQARRNRRRIVDATHRLLLAQGYRATSMAAVAREAAVSVETVYKAFKAKRRWSRRPTTSSWPATTNPSRSPRDPRSKR